MNAKIVKILALVFVLILLDSIPATAQTSSDNSLIAEWHFDEGSGNIVKDSSGNGNDGIIHGATFVEGISGYALNFDGIDDYVYMGYKEIFDITEQITIEAWVNWNPGARGIDQIVNKWLTYGIGIDSGDSTGICFLGDDNKQHGSGTVYFIPYQGKWTYLTGTYDGNVVKYYINGELVREQKYKGKIATSGIPLKIGANEVNQDIFEGIIDEVAIYNRALSQEEILAKYVNMMGSRKPSPTTIMPTELKYDDGTSELPIAWNAPGCMFAVRFTPSFGNYQILRAKVYFGALNNPSDPIRIHALDSNKKDLIPPIDFTVTQEKQRKWIEIDFSSKNIVNSGDFYIAEEQIVAGDPDIGTDLNSPCKERSWEFNGVEWKLMNDRNYMIRTEVIQLPTATSTPPALTPTLSPSPTQIPTPTKRPTSASVNLYGEKTDVVLGEDIMLRLSAVNLITKPPMTVQCIIIPPSGMSVTSAEFTKTAAGQYTTTYKLEPGDGKDIEVRIKPNQIGDFVVEGRIVYYFGDDVTTGEDHTLTLPIKVKPTEPMSKPTADAEVPLKPEIPGFEVILAIAALLAVAYLVGRKK